jgi:hypothetical protein
VSTCARHFDFDVPVCTSMLFLSGNAGAGIRKIDGILGVLLLGVCLPRRPALCSLWVLSAVCLVVMAMLSGQISAGYWDLIIRRDGG